MPKIFTFVFALLLTLTQSCGNKQTPQNNTKSSTAISKPVAPPTIKLESPANGSNFTTADNVEIRFKTLSDTIKIDSTLLSINDKREGFFNGFSRTLPLAKSKIGVQRVSLAAYSLGKQIGTLAFAFTVKPQQKPKLYTYKVVKEYNHDKGAYTQGLFFNNGALYEGTGEYGSSSLRKVNLQTGEVLQNINIEKKYFGEGICLLNNKIYQLTWREHTGFIYNAETFEKMGTFSYSTEGWGITTDGKYLIMSNGTEKIFFINPDNMSIVKQIEVYSHEGPIFYLNELEYINGEIWANIYTSDSIARIDPETGTVLGMIDLKNILKQSEYKSDTDVLNGIAYDPAANRIFVTGKKWPKLFEIKVTEN